MKSDDLSLLVNKQQQQLNPPIIVLFESDNVLGGGIPKSFPLGSWRMYSLKTVTQQLKLQFCDSEFT